MKVPPASSILSGVRLLLAAGFGGLLVLLGFLAYSSATVLQSVETANAESSRDFVRRDDALEAVRQHSYLANKNVREYLLDPDPVSAEAHRQTAAASWGKAQSALEAYQGVSLTDAGPLLGRLKGEFAEYWRTASRTFDWTSERRRTGGYAELTKRLDPLRDQFRSTLDEIRLLDQRGLRQSLLRSSQAIDQLQSRLGVTIAVTLLLGLLLAGVTYFHLVGLENAARARFEDLRSAHAELERLSQRVLDIQEEERRTLARELHDEVGQSLSALLVDLGAAHASANHRHLDSAKGLAEKTLASIRNICLLLRPSMLDDLGLIPALHWQARETTRRTGVPVRLLAENGDLELPDAYRTAVYRVVQEALQNAARHASASQVQIMVRQDGRRLLIVVQDDGKGFDPASTKGLGLLGMQERVAHLNGALRIESEPGRGTVLQIEIPLESVA
jgi:signal transduction histidine kinase